MLLMQNSQIAIPTHRTKVTIATLVFIPSAVDGAFILKEGLY